MVGWSGNKGRRGVYFPKNQKLFRNKILESRNCSDGFYAYSDNIQDRPQKQMLQLFVDRQSNALIFLNKMVYGKLIECTIATMILEILISLQNPLGASTYDVRLFQVIFDLPTYRNQMIYYISLFSKIRWCLTYLPTLKSDVICGCSLSIS